MGEGGWQEVLYNVRDKTKILSELHANYAVTIEKTVVQELEGVRAELKSHISALEKEASTIADEVEKEVRPKTDDVETISPGALTL